MMYILTIVLHLRLELSGILKIQDWLILFYSEHEPNNHLVGVYIQV
jgi:hypothetical protein